MLEISHAEFAEGAELVYTQRTQSAQSLCAARRHPWGIRAIRAIRESSSHPRRSATALRTLRTPRELLGTEGAGRADEPSAALDPRNRRNLIRIINQFDHLKIIASHDLDFIWDTCGRVSGAGPAKRTTAGTDFSSACC